MGNVFQIPNSVPMMDLVFDSPFEEIVGLNCKTFIYHSSRGPIGFDREDEAECIAMNFVAGSYVWWSEPHKEVLELNGEADSISQIRRSVFPRGIVIHTPDASLTYDLKRSKPLWMDLKVNALKKKHNLSEKELKLPFIFRLFNSEKKLRTSEFQQLLEHSQGISLWRFSDHGHYFNLFEKENSLENKLLNLCCDAAVPFSRITDPKQIPYW
jgi:hypothetical protein